MGSVRTGSLVGSVGGVLFVLLNAGVLGSPAALVVRVLGVAAFAAAVWLSVLRPGAPRSGPPPSRGALRTYLLCVLGEVVAIPLGAQVLTRAVGRPDLVLPWVVLVVGVHFAPFARTFGVPLFGRLALTLIVLGVVGGILTALVGGAAGGLTAVVAGFVLMAFAAVGALPRTRTARVDQRHGWTS